MNIIQHIGSRHLLFLASIFIVIGIIVVYVDMLLGDGEITKLYYVYADQIVNGKMPYEDFTVEYPPVALVFFVIPRLFTANEIIYSYLFLFEIIIFVLIGLWVVKKLVEKYGKDKNQFMSLFIIMLILSILLVYTRFDVFPMIITLLSLYCFFTKRYALAWILLGIGTMIKFYPALLVPIFLIPLLANRKWIESMKGILIFCATILLILLPFIILAPDNWMDFLSYHLDRGLQIESVAASFILMGDMLGLTSVIIPEGVIYGSWNIEGSWVDAILPLLMPIMIVLVSVICLLCLVTFIKAYKNENLNNTILIAIPMFVTLILLTFILFGKVFSPQYMIWLTPFFLVLYMLPLCEKMRKKYLFMALLSLVLTTTLFCFYDNFIELATLPILILFARNILLLVMLGSLFWDVYNLFVSKKNKIEPNVYVHNTDSH